VAGGNAGGVELPRHITQAWVDATALMPGQQRVKVRTGSGTDFEIDGASLAVLNWNDDGKADVLLVGTATGLDLNQGVVLSGALLWSGTGAINFALPPVAGAEALARFRADDRPRSAEALEILGGVPNAETAAATFAPQMRAAVAGDVNGDGLDDVLLTDPGFLVFPAPPGSTSPTTRPNVGRAYLVTGRSEAQGAIDRDIDLDQDSDLIIQDYSFAAGGFALGDLNHDGYDDVAIASAREARRATPADTAREGGLFVI